MGMNRPKYIDNKKWWTINEFETRVLTDIAPPLAVIEYNESAQYSMNYMQKDYYIYPQDYYNMKKRIGLSYDEIIKDIKEIYTSEEVTNYLAMYDKDNNLKP